MPLRRPRRRRIVASITLGLLAVSGCSAQAPEPRDVGPPAPPESSTSGETPEEETPIERREPLRVQKQFFGMHDGRVTRGITPAAPAGSLRFWDSATSWLHLETGPGQFTWSGLDTAVAAAEAVGARPLLVLGQTPAFHASRPAQDAAYGPGAGSMPDLDAWRRYVTEVAERYGSRIDYQVWNETNVVGYWTGTPRQMAELTLVASRAIRHAAPRATVVAPAFALRLKSQRRYFSDYWAWQSRGIDLASALDVVAVHLYPPAEDPPETQVRLLKSAREVLARHEVELPVWNTEINFGLLGGPEPPPIPAERQRAFLMRTYLLNAGLGVPRVYWYRWDLAPIANTLLTTPDYASPTLAGRAFATIRHWLDGAVVDGCEVSEGLWECSARRDGRRVLFWWKPRGTGTRVSADEAASWTSADGAVTRCRRSCRVPVDETPVMVVQDP